MLFKIAAVCLVGTCALAVVAQTAAPVSLPLANPWPGVVVTVATLVTSVLSVWITYQQAKLKTKVDTNDTKTDAIDKKVDAAGADQKEMKESMVKLEVHTNSMKDELVEATKEAARATLLDEQRLKAELKEQFRNEWLVEQQKAFEAARPAGVIAAPSATGNPATATQSTGKLAGIVPIEEVTAIIVEDSTTKQTVPPASGN